MVNIMRTRIANAKSDVQKSKRDILAEKWMTNLLAFILILLIVVFVILSIPAVKNQIVNLIRVILYGKEQKPERPEVSPVGQLNPLRTPSFSIKGNCNAYQLVIL